MALPNNVCGTDRKLRGMVGLVVAIVAVKLLERDQARRGTALSIVAGELIFNTLFQFCPLNAALGINTCQGTASETERLRETVLP